MTWPWGWGRRRILCGTYRWRWRCTHWILVDEDGRVVGETIGGTAYLMSPMDHAGRYINGRRARRAVEDALYERIDRGRSNAGK